MKAKKNFEKNGIFSFLYSAFIINKMKKKFWKNEYHFQSFSICVISFQINHNDDDNNKNFFAEKRQMDLLKPEIEREREYL